MTDPILNDERVRNIRQQFPAFERRENGFPVGYFDGPAGTQVPRSVAEAVSRYLLATNANHGGLFQTSIESDVILDHAHQAFADFVGCEDPGEIAFGQNMTSLTFAFSRALSQEWEPGDEIIVTRMDHDANVTPWVLAARDRGASVNFVEFDPLTFELNLDHLHSLLSERTRLVAVGCASNASGTINPVREICDMARSFGALSYLDAVHYAPHRRIDVGDFGCDFLVCSSYKFFGPHTGIFWGKREHLERIPAYKVRPAPDELPGKWMTGTQSHECIAGSTAAIDYLAGLGRELVGEAESQLSRKDALDVAFRAIAEYEAGLADRLLQGFETIPGLKVWGIPEPGRRDARVATFSITLDDVDTEWVAQQLCERGHFVWHGNYYALEFSQSLGLEPGGMVRIGAMHYNTLEEVDRLLADLRIIAAPKLV